MSLANHSCVLAHTPSDSPCRVALIDRGTRRVAPLHMGSTTHSIVRRIFHLLPFLLWSIVTAVALERAPLAAICLAGVIFAIIAALAYAVLKFGVEAEGADPFRS